MNNEWYEVSGITHFEEQDIHILNLDLLVKATSVEEACQKVREFVKPIAEFEPTKCNWKP